MRLLVILIIGGLIYAIQNLIFKKNWSKALSVNVEYEENIVREGEKNVLVETIENNKGMPLPIVQIKFSITKTFVFPKEDNSSVTDNYYRSEFFTLRPHQKITRKYRFVASRRGEYKLNSLDIICKDLFLQNNMFAGSNASTYVTVLPGRISKGQVTEEILRLTGEVVKRNKIYEDPFEFRSIRDYSPNDPMNHINWKATARTDDLMVNTFNTTDNKNVTILLNLDVNAVLKREAILEEAIRIADYLANTFIENHMSVALYTNGFDYETNEQILIDEGSNASHLMTIDINLARLDLNQRIASFSDLCKKYINKNDHNMEYVIISNYRKNDFAEMYHEYKEEGLNMSLIIPEMSYNSIEPFSESGVAKWVVNDEI